MDPCHSVSTRSPAVTSAVTVAHLIRNIEQLKNKDKLISQLEKDLGHQWVAAHLAALERECVEGARGTTMCDHSTPLSVLPEDSYDPKPFTRTLTSTPTNGGVEEGRSSNVEGYLQGKQDLSKKLKDSKDRNKELVEKCRAYLQRNKELTAQNRAYKDSSEKVLQENKKMHELLEHSKLRVLQLSRNLNEAQTVKTTIEKQIDKVDELKKEMMQDKKTICALKQACSDKDRRIELMLHRKKKRRLAGSEEKSMGMKETFFGYEEDTRSVDSENSFSSLSHSTFSDEDVLDDVLSREETESNYQRLMMDHLKLQGCYAQLQNISGHTQDPQREAMTKMTLQNDLFDAQCRIEKLERLINEIGEGEVISLLKERETIIENSKEFLEKAQFWEIEGRRVQKALNTALERCEDLEFQLMEIEQVNDEKQSSTCEDSIQDSLTEDDGLLERLAEVDHQQHAAVQDMENLRKDLVVLLKGKGREGDAALKKFDMIADDERKRAESLESIAGELQMKVISLQKEKDSLLEKISLKGEKLSKGDHAAAIAARERQENLELKNEVAQLSRSESKLLAERIHLNEQIEDWKTQYEFLKQQLDFLTKTMGNQKQSPPKEESASEGDSSPRSLTRRPSKDRKSKSQSTDDPTERKRRRSSKDLPACDDLRGGPKSLMKIDAQRDTNHQQSAMKSMKSIDDIWSMTESVNEIEELQKALKTIESQLQNMKEENINLQDQLKQCAIERSSEAEADQQILLDKLEVLEAEKGLLLKENEALAKKLKQHMDELHDTQDELNPRVAELEDFCEDLQERLRASEISERQVRDKLRKVEQSIDDAESSEMAVRERYEELLSREAEAKKQIQELQKTGRELKDIVLDKDFVEQALLDKVDFLQKAEAASTKRIDELEAVEQELRELLELRTDTKDSCQRELHKIQELKHQITFLETDNKALSARVSELEENEEILRENWRRVADEDFNRTQCLEEKVKMLEVLNKDLKSKLTDAQEYFVINTVPSSQNSLAAELAQMQSRAPRRAATFDDGGGDDDDDDDDEDSVDGGAGSNSPETSRQADVEKRGLRDKLRQLEKQMSDVAEEKNTKIESLQEKIVSLKENEIKLSETISELEMTERELRAKLALYESSEVTVEKMLKYQSKIEELRTSQESLLDQIESMENQEMTMQEKMQEMERTLRGKIVTLEVEMRGFKQKELKDAAKVRELEKQEKELSEKVAQQAEKENGLYVKISSLMDELKKAKEELNVVKATMLEKEDKVRNANLLEVRMMEKEMENGKKISSLSTKLRHKEEELRQKESAHEEKLTSLQRELSEKDTEATQQITILENMLAQKENNMQATISSLNENVKELRSERDMLKEIIEKERQRTLEAENRIISLESELAREKENVLAIESKIVSLKGDIGEKMKNIELSFVEKESQYVKERLSMQNELSMKDAKMRELEKELDLKLQYVRELESEREKLKSKAASSESETENKLANMENILATKDERCKELEISLAEKEGTYSEQVHLWERKYNELKENVLEKNKMIEELKENNRVRDEELNRLSSMKQEQESQESELKKRLAFLNIQLVEEVTAREKAQASLEKHEDKEKATLSEINELKKEVEKHRLQLIEKLSELESKNRENCELSLELSNLRHSWKISQTEIDGFKNESTLAERKFQNQISEQEQIVEKLRKELDFADKEKQHLKLELSQKDSLIKEAHIDKENYIKEKEVEIEKLVELKTQQEVLVQEHVNKNESLMQKSVQEQQYKEVELESLKKGLDEKDVLLKKQTSRQSEMDVQMQELSSEIKTLKQKIKHFSGKLDDKTSEVKDCLLEIEKLKEERDAKSSEVEHLQRQVSESHDEIEKRIHEHVGTETVISAKQHELDLAKLELHKCLQEIEEYKKGMKEKEDELHQQEMISTKMTANMEQLDVQFREQSEGYKHLESKANNAERRLVEAENRYRELEAKCASLEMQLKERFLQAQYAEKVTKNKEAEYQQLEMKLTTVEKDFEATTSHVQEAEQIIMLKHKECKQLEAELEEAVKSSEQLRVSLAQTEDKHKQTSDKFSSLQTEHQQLQSELSVLHQKFIGAQTQQEGHESEAQTLRNELSALKDAYHEAQSQLTTSNNKLKEINVKNESMEKRLIESNSQRTELDSKFLVLQSDSRNMDKQLEQLQRRYNSLETKLKLSEENAAELEQSKDRMIVSLEMKIKESVDQCTEVKLSLEKTESELRSKSIEFDALKDELDKTKQNLRIAEKQCNVLEENVKNAEEKLKEHSHVASELTSSLANAEKALREKESFCRDSQNDLNSTEQKYVMIQKECENVRSKLTYFQEKAERLQASSDKSEKSRLDISSVLEQTKSELSDAQNKLSESDIKLQNLVSQLQHSQHCLNSSQEKVQSLEENINQFREDTRDLASRYEKLTQEYHDKETLCRNLSSDLQIEKNQAEDLQLQLQKAVESHEHVCAKLQESENHHSSIIAELRAAHTNTDSIVQQSENKYTQLESLCHRLQEEVDSKCHVIEQIRSSEKELMSSISQLHQENASLKAKLDAAEDTKHSNESEFTELIETNQSLSGKLYQLEKKSKESDQHIAHLEESVSKLGSEKSHMFAQVKQLQDEKIKLESENAILEKKLTDAMKGLEILRNEFDMRRAKAEMEMNKLSMSMEDNQKLLQQSQSELSEKDDLIAKLEKQEEMVNLKMLSSENGGNELLDFPDGQKSRFSESEIVHESEYVSVSTGRQAKQQSQAASKVSSELKETAKSENHDDDGPLTKLSRLMNEIEMYKKSDIANQEKLRNLEKTLKEIREKESRMSERVHELESKEKELLEQIADIETKVIVPLEAENQELKDEISMVKQERDDAQARVGKWGGEDEEQQDIEAVHKSLEDALILRDELEKKVEILSADVTRLEEEKENSLKKMIDLEASEAEYQDKISSLEFEVERLHGLEKTTSLVEETETCLIDRVLDLEEKEQQLLAEIAQLKNKTHSDQTYGQPSNPNLLERLKYLEQKNALLQDSEGQYMDKIVELEEIQHRLQSQIINMQSSSGGGSESSSREPVLVNSDSILVMMQKTSAQANAEPQNTSVSTDTQDLYSPSEQTQSDVSPDVAELERKLKNLTAECEEKTSKLKYLEEKCQLLYDSEARLMEKLEESEENTKHINTKAASHSDENDLKKKLENLMEENEFLAESIENFKQLYKEEKEKTNELRERVMEDTSTLQELQDAKAELRSTQLMVEDIQSEYEEQLSEREEQEAQLNIILAKSQLREKDLQSQLTALQEHSEELQRKFNAVIQGGGISKEFAEEEKIEALHKLEAELRSHFNHQVEDLQKQVHLLQTQQAAQKEQETEYQDHMEDILKDQQELQKEVGILTQKELGLQKQVILLRQREQDLLYQIGGLEKQREEMSSRLRDSAYQQEEDSIQSDSGMSADDQNARYCSSGKNSSTDQPLPPESPITQKVFSSTVTLNLSQPTSSTTGRTTITKCDEVKASLPEPVPPPRRGKARKPSIDSIAQEELAFLVEELQNKEFALKKRLRELEALVDSDLSQKIEDLELENQTLKRKLKYAESEIARASSQSPAFVPETGRLTSLFGNDGNNNAGSTEDIEENKDLDGSFSSVLSSSSTQIMLEKAEDVLQKKIKELENLDKHNKMQVSELERDREVLHEIARKDKATIHELSVKIRELQLSERGLKEQVNSLEASEGSLYTKCEDLEAMKTKLEDRVHELSVHERRLRELVRRLKLDEEHWLSKSGGMETAVAELSANEQQLKRLLQDVEMQKGGLSERADYLEARVRELESVEASLLQRLRNYENVEVNLQNKLVHLENSEIAAHSKVSELDVINVDISQKLQKAIEENVVRSQHVFQLQGQIIELDRQLLSSRDSELAHKQHMESLQKNESSLQKKVREFELREIDSQGRVRELEQLNDILNDKTANLQRSENRLKFRVQELENVVVQTPGEISPTQLRKVPQKLEDCQKCVLLLQNQVEGLQLQLRDALSNVPQTQLASKTNEGKKVSMTLDDYRQLQTKSVLLEESNYQMEELERVNRELTETILHLRQGKGACGHEVEIEVLKRRLASYKTFINKLKSSLSEGQATSLWDPELDSGLQGSTLPARQTQIPGLESERVLQPVRGHQDGKADTSNTGGAQQTGLIHDKESIVQSKATLSVSSHSLNLDSDDDSIRSKPEQTSRHEESHWRAIEARKPNVVASSWGGALATVGAGAKQAPPTHHNGSKQSSALEVEEVVVGLYLQSESELSSHHRTTQNDTDSSGSPVPPPRRGRTQRAVKSINNSSNASSESSDGLLTDSSNNTLAKTAGTTNKEHYFDNGKSQPSPATKNTSEELLQNRTPLTHFGEDSFYLPSSAQEGVDSLDDGEAPPLPNSGPPGAQRQLVSPRSREGSVDKNDLSDNSTSGMSIRDRIAMIERQIHTDKIGDKPDNEQVSYWKKKAGDGLKQAKALEKDNKHLKDDIIRLEKELEEKCRYINLFELWLSNLEDLLKNKNKQTDRQLMEQLHQELTKLRSDLKFVGKHNQGVVLDPAILKIELEDKDREIQSKRSEVDALTRQLKQCQQECKDIEVMRQTAVDTIRALEYETVGLQESGRHLLEAQAELQSLRDQYDELQNDKHQAEQMIQPLQAKLDRLARKCQKKDALLHRLGAELRLCTYRPSSALDELGHLEQAMSQEEYNTDFPHIARPALQRQGIQRTNSGSSSVEELEMIHPYSDTDSLPATNKKKTRLSPYVNTRPKSAETLDSRPRIQPGTHAHPRSTSGLARSGAHPQFMASEMGPAHFVAVADYDPNMFSQSGRPELELELREGELVIVTGPVDRNGYYEAEVRGRAGLVPANYLQPIHGRSNLAEYSTNPRLARPQLERRPEQHAASVHRWLQQEAAPPRRDGPSAPRGDQARPVGGAWVGSNTLGSALDPPSRLHIKGIITETSLLLSWLPPKLDSRGHNRGVKLLGFVVYVNNEEYSQIRSPKICEAVVEDLNLRQAHHLAVQCLCAGGRVSPRAELIFEGISRVDQGHGRAPDQVDLDTDLSSVLSNAHYKRGQRRAVIAVYGYNPQKQSPLDYVTYELAFQAGELIHVFGEPRPDGFFHGEIQGKRGLVPACFVEDISRQTLQNQTTAIDGASPPRQDRH